MAHSPARYFAPSARANLLELTRRIRFQHAETSEDLYSSHGSNATAASNQENDTVEESTPDIEKHTDDGTPGVPEDEPVEESHEDHAVESQPSDKQEKAESPSLQNSAKEFHLPPQEKTLSSDGAHCLHSSTHDTANVAFQA